MKSNRMMIKFLTVVALALNLDFAPDRLMMGTIPLTPSSAQAQIGTILRQALKQTLKYCIRRPGVVGGTCIGGFWTTLEIYDRVYPSALPPPPPATCQEVFDAGTSQAELFCNAIDSDSGFPTEQFANLADCIAKIRCEYWKANQTQCNSPACAGLKNFMQTCDCLAPPLNIPGSGFSGTSGEDEEEEGFEGSEPNDNPLNNGGLPEAEDRH